MSDGDFGGFDAEFGVPDAEDDFETFERDRLAEDDDGEEGDGADE